MEDFFEKVETQFGINIASYINQWYTVKQFPKFEAYDAKRTQIIKENKKVYHITYKIYNSGAVEGVIRAWIGGRYDNV